MGLAQRVYANYFTQLSQVKNSMGKIQFIIRNRHNVIFFKFVGWLGCLTRPRTPPTTWAGRVAAQHARGSGVKRHYLMRSAPWSNQKVGFFFRLLAYIFVMCGVFSIFAIIYWCITNKVPAHLLPLAAIMLLCIAYDTCLFAFSALKGRAPSGWLPWR